MSNPGGRSGDPVPLSQGAARPDLTSAVTVATALPRRPGFGREGQRIMLLANHFNVDQNNLPKDLIFEVARRRNWGNYWAYGGQSTLYGARELLPDTREGETVIITDSRGREEEFCVRIRGLGATSIRAPILAYADAKSEAILPAEALAALDTVARHRRACDPISWAIAGRNLVKREAAIQLGAGLELWAGYNLSVRPTQPTTGGCSLSVLIDRAAAAFVAAQSVEKYLGQVTNYQEPHPNSPAWKKAHKALRGLKVMIQPDPKDKTTRREYRARGLSRLVASQCVFPNTELGRQDNVADYFERKLKRKLKYPNLPCVDVSRSSAKQILLPLELCDIVAGQRRQMVDDPAASASMIKFTAMRPADRQKAIVDSVKEHVANDQTMQAFGLTVGPQMRRLQGRKLPAPMLEYARNTVQPEGGTWNMRENQLRMPPPPDKLPRAWSAVCLDASHEQPLRAFVGPFADMMRRTAGITMPGQPQLLSARSGETVEATLRRATQGVNFVLICLADSSADTYERVKALCDRTLGIVSQCMLPKHLTGGGPRGGGPRCGGRGGGGPPSSQYMANLALKFNAKMGGTNVIVASPQGRAAIPGISEEPTMLFGADVSHPAPGSDSPSFVSVVGSLDAHATRYATRLATQPGAQEHITALQSMCVELLKEFNASTRIKPSRIVFYRDGISEGQFQKILLSELPALRDAFAAMGDGSYRPKLTFIVLQKRHQTRLFVEEPRDGDRSGNVPAGTVVDSDICHPGENDFFLMSHAGLQGTSRPVHYHVLLDENNLGADALQRMAWYLCHLFCRCTRTVSIVPPVYYAHLAAFRARVYHAAAGGSDTESMFSAGSGGASGVEAAGGASLDVHATLQQSMFFV